MEALLEAIGWVGTLLIVLAYFLNSAKKIASSSKAYHLMNLAGAVGIGANVYHHGAWPSFALQIGWGAIAIVTLIKK